MYQYKWQLYREINMLFKLAFVTYLLIYPRKTVNLVNQSRNKILNFLKDQEKYANFINWLQKKKKTVCVCEERM